jgi:truncated hemoglobin YjbI
MGLLILAVLLLGKAGFPQAAESQPGATGGTDRQIYDALRTVINAGADLYNKQNDRAGCYRLYQGALLTVRPLLSSHAELQKAIDAGLADSDRQFRVEERAFTLRKVLDHIRETLRSGWTKNAAASSKDSPPTTSEKRAERVDSQSESLWKQLGGEAKVRQIVDDWVALAAVDAKVNFSRNGKYTFTDAQVADLKSKLVAYISQATGGPLKPPPQEKNMKELHKAMHITNPEFDAAVADLKKALDGRDVNVAAAQDLITLVQRTRKDIVETPATPETKGESKKGGGNP